MSSTDFFGWDLLFKTVKNDIKDDADILVALIHWFMVRNSSFRCLSTGDDKTLNENEIGSELLPDLWNDNEGGSYTLRYICNKKLFILYASKLDEDKVTFNIMDASSRDVTNLTLNIKEIVKSREGAIEHMIPDISNVINRIKTELIEPMNTGYTKEGSTQTSKEEERGRQPESSTPPLLFPNPPAPFSGQIGAGIRDPLRDIGRGDLDPFHRGGGMLFPSPGSSTANDPFAIGPPRYPGLRIPPPPDARFDPFGPPDANIRPNPNPDHFRPPPDFDDMYM